MEVIQNLLAAGSIALLAATLAVYFLKYLMEKRIDVAASRVEELAKTAFAITREMRWEERKEIVEFRVAVERFEYFLQSCLFEATIGPASAFSVAELQKNDSERFLQVRVGLVRACVYLRDEALEQELLATILEIRRLYYPLIFDALPGIIDLQAEIGTIEAKLKRFEESGMKDTAAAPTEADRERHLALQSKLTEEMRRYSDAVVAAYPPIAEKLVELKSRINAYLYRPVIGTEVRDAPAAPSG